MSIEINQNQIKNAEELAIHYLPAKIEEEGTANVDNYFNNYTRVENGVLQNALRGYPLYGCVKTPPDGYKGVVLQEPPNSEGASLQERKFHLTGTFDKLTYWNYDRIPSNDDAYFLAMQWPELAKQLSSPITEAEVLAEIEAHKIEQESKENKE